MSERGQPPEDAWREAATTGARSRSGGQAGAIAVLALALRARFEAAYPPERSVRAG